MTPEVLLISIETAGSHEIAFNSNAVATGSNIVQLEAGGKKVTRQLQIVR